MATIVQAAGGRGSSGATGSHAQGAAEVGLGGEDPHTCFNIQRIPEFENRNLTFKKTLKQKKVRQTFTKEQHCHPMKITASHKRSGIIQFPKETQRGRQDLANGIKNRVIKTCIPFVAGLW